MQNIINLTRLRCQTASHCTVTNISQHNKTSNIILKENISQKQLPKW